MERFPPAMPPVHMEFVKNRQPDLRTKARSTKGALHWALIWVTGHVDSRHPEVVILLTVVDGQGHPPYRTMRLCPPRRRGAQGAQRGR